MATKLQTGKIDNVFLEIVTLRNSRADRKSVVIPRKCRNIRMIINSNNRSCDKFVLKKLQLNCLVPNFLRENMSKINTKKGKLKQSQYVIPRKLKTLNINHL